jgi:hypothetical protein
MKPVDAESQGGRIRRICRDHVATRRAITAMMFFWIGVPRGKLISMEDDGSLHSALRIFEK